MKHKYIPLIFVIFSSLAIAQEKVPEGFAVAESLKFMSEQKHKEACEVLNKSEKQSMTVNILLAQCFSNLTDFPKAEQHYKLALKDTNSPKIHYELAHVLLKQGKTSEAGKEFQFVLTKDAPSEIKKNIEDFLIRKNQVLAQEKTWGISGSIGFISDSNVNAGPSTDSTTIYGLPFTLSKDALKSSDTGIKLSLGLNQNTNINENFNWLSTAGYEKIDYNKYQNFNSQNISIASGPKYSLENFQFTTQLTYLKDYLDNSDYRTLYGVTWNGLLILNEKLALITVGNQLQQEYANISGHNGKINSFGSGVAYIFDNNGSRINLLAKRNNISADELANSSRENQYSISVFKNLPYDITLTGEYSYTQARNNGMDTMYLVRRSDHKDTFSIGLTKKLTDKTSINFNLINTSNNSNIDINNYDRRQFSLSINQSF